MIIVTGTKRSGTSMWLQILKAAGFPLLGDAFPHDWGETIRAANEGGFYESPLRNGIYYATNPHPLSGAFLPPQQTRSVAVKVFALGLVRTDLAYLDNVVASMRHWREYAPSVERLWNMETESKRARAEQNGQPAAAVLDFKKMSPVLEWWRDNYALIRDALVRRYPLHMVSYDSVLREPDAAITETLHWLGGGDATLASAAVRSELRTQKASERPAPSSVDESGLSVEQQTVFDELYARIDLRQPLDAAFIDRLNETQNQLAPQIAAEEERARSDREQAVLRANTARASAAEPSR